MTAVDFAKLSDDELLVLIAFNEEVWDTCPWGDLLLVTAERAGIDRGKIIDVLATALRLDMPKGERWETGDLPTALRMLERAARGGRFSRVDFEAVVPTPRTSIFPERWNYRDALLSAGMIAAGAPVTRLPNPSMIQRLMGYREDRSKKAPIEKADLVRSVISWDEIEDGREGLRNLYGKKD